MPRAKRKWLGGRPGEAALDESAGPAGRTGGDDPLVEDVPGDPMVDRAHGDDPLVHDVPDGPPAEPASGGDPLAEPVRGDPLAEPVRGGDPLGEPVRGDPLAEPVRGDPLAAPVRGVAGDVDGQESHDQLTGDGEHDRFVARWQEIQTGFVDDPRRAVQDADALVVDLMDRLAHVLAEERDRLDSRPGTGEDVSTEDLRQGLRRYRSLFERLLAV